MNLNKRQAPHSNELKDRVTVFVTDPGFLVPTLVVAKQLANHKAHKYTDIIIFLLDIEVETISMLEKSFGKMGIKFHLLKTSSFKPKKDHYFNRNHVPETTLARLILTDYIPEQYQHVVYMDGDTQIVGDISPLMQYEVPKGKIASINGSMWLKMDSSLDHVAKSYLKGLNNINASDYFNAGILAFQRETWAEIGPQALEFFFQNSKSCNYHDQSALNAVCKGRRVALPPSYNFHSEYAKLYVQPFYKPNIVHFTSGCKPWLYAVTPWGKSFAKPYIDILKEYPYLAKYMQKPANISHMRELIRNIIKVKREIVPNTKELIRKRNIFLNYIKTEQFPF